LPFLEKHLGSWLLAFALLKSGLWKNVTCVINLAVVSHSSLQVMSSFLPSLSALWLINIPLLFAACSHFLILLTATSKKKLCDAYLCSFFFAAAWNGVDGIDLDV
jgi:hypothetical protein